MGSSREERLSRAFVELADTLVDDFDVVELLTTLTMHCVDLLDVHSSGVMITDPHGNLIVIGASSEQTRELELREIQSDQGPCLDCYRSGEPQSAADLATETRWPRFTPLALSHGYRALHAVPLRLRSRVIGALNLMRTTPVPLGPAELRTAQALADIATVGLLSHRRVGLADLVTDQLLAARTSRSLTEQAVNVVAERWQLDTAEAFRVLQERSRKEGISMSELSHDIARGTFDITALAGIIAARARESG
ncbi:GAF and ANTAR domain-containing protein [Streptomyces syringium]|uniref:GAF and ANTAR domain-containing protein n=1 Tax=Streptomyces syringium TaxID=76729 RepID=UPI00343B421F